MDAAGWDARYATTELVWGADPNRWVVETFAGRPPGTALDLGTGEGRNALWLAGRGWDVTAVDFSATAIGKARALQAEHAPQSFVRTTWLQADVLTHVPSARTFAAVLAIFLHFPDTDRRALIRNAANALSVGGVLLVVGHDRTNPTQGVGGPSDPAVLFDAADVIGDLGGLDGLEIRRAERVGRAVGGEGRVAMDALVEVARIS